jgi:hypothetical protein
MPGEVTFQNDPVDPAAEFGKQQNHFFVAERAERLDPGRAAGELIWKRMSLAQRVSYHQVTLQLEDLAVWRDQPEEEYEDERASPFALEFVSPRCVRLRLAARPGPLGEGRSPMLEDYEPGPAWPHSDDGERATWRSEHGSLALRRDPWQVELRDAAGRLLTRTNHHSGSPGVLNTNPVPLSYVRSSARFHRHLAISLELSPGERLYGCGESFTRLDKRGQLLNLWTRDAYSAQTRFMYKPVPFLLSSRGYGVFAHTSAPVTFDLGHGYDGAAVLFLGEDVADLFVFLGGPKEVVSEYTTLTGRARMPPRWSFGLWMGRDTYSSAQEVRAVAARLRRERIPCDVLHVDTDWPEHKFRVDFEFSRTRFPEPERFLAELREQGFRLSLWQLPYLHPKNHLHAEAVRERLVVLSSDGRPPVDDAVIDLTGDDAVRWYQDKLRGLLEQGVATFVCDFGEAAPFGGIYRADPAGVDEHLPPARALAPVRLGRGLARGARMADARRRGDPRDRPGARRRCAAPGGAGPAHRRARLGPDRGVATWRVTRGRRGLGSPAVDLDAEIDRLYGLQLDEFVGERDALAKRVRQEGDREAADRVKALRKPTAGAWALNQALRRRRAERDGLLAAGERLREAHEALLSGGDPAALREAMQEERIVAGVLADCAEAIASETGKSGPALKDRVRATLHAAAVDEEARAELEAGRFVREREAVGLGPLGASLPAPAVKRKTAPKGGRATPRADTGKRGRAAAAERTAGKRGRAAAAERGRAGRAAPEPSAADRAAAAERERAARLAEAERRLDEARAALEEAGAAHEDAAARLESARQAVREAEAAERAARKLARGRERDVARRERELERLRSRSGT